ncbi:MAG: flagellar hook-associated protein FlgK [Bacteroidota bacterium]
MASTFFGLEIGRSGLVAHQKALDVAGQNMANASTPGYSRQRAEIATTYPFTDPSFVRENTAGQMGTGVEVTAVLRIRDQLIDNQIQDKTSSLGYWEARQQMLDKMESIVNEPSDANIRTDIDQFWVAIQKLADNPRSIPIRSALRQQTLTLATTIREDYASIKNLRKDANDYIKQDVSEINRIAAEIADLNVQIGKVTAIGDHPNDLMDKRDSLLEELAKMINISHVTDKLNKMTVYVGGIPLVDGDSANSIIMENNPQDDNMVRLKWKQPSGQEVQILSGELQGLFQIRDYDIPKVLNNLNDFAATLIDKVNSLHRTGFGLDESTGNDFFAGINAEDIDLSAALKDGEEGLNRIAASESILKLPGDNTIMQGIYELKHTPVLTNGTSTFNDFIGAVVTEIGELSSTAKTKAENQEALIGNLDLRRESVCGVNLDEEMTDMVRFQHGYNASAKIISTMDAMLDVLINQLKTSP